MAWAVSKPEDWQLGGKCDAYLWGSGRHGQLCETGRAVLTPHLTSSFKTAQQVMIVTLIAPFAAILLERVRVKIHCSQLGFCYDAKFLLFIESTQFGYIFMSIQPLHCIFQWIG